MAGPARRLVRRLGTVRVRATAASVVVLGVALVGASAVMLVVLRDAHVDGVRTDARLRLARVVTEVASGTDPVDLALDEGEDRFTQVVAGTRVIASSATVSGVASLAERTGTDEALPFGDRDDRWLVVAEAAPGGPTVVVGRELDPASETLSAAATALAIGVPLLLGLAGATTWMVVGRSLAPVEAMRREVDAITASDLGRRVPEPDSGDEIAQLATTMNAMLERLDGSHRRQRRFVSDASHELRSPITSIRQHAEVALAHPDRTNVPELAAAVLADELRVQELVEDLLILARADEGASGQRRDVDLDDLVLAEVERLRATGGVHVDTSGVGAGRVHGDERSLGRAVRNVVDNAARHARSEIRVAVVTAAGRAIVTVDDDGAGIPVADRDRIFERFVRLDDSRSRPRGGSGLGLAIVAEVVTAHGGRVAVDDGDLGGVRFRLTFPTADPGGSVDHG